MKKLTTMLTCMCLLAALTANGQRGSFPFPKKIKGSEKMVTKKLPVEHFTKIKVTGLAQVNVTQKSGKPRLKVTTSDNLFDVLDCHVANNTLHIGFRQDVNVLSCKKLEVNVCTETLELCSVSGAVKLELEDGFRLSGDLALHQSGMGKIEADDIKCHNLSASLSGNGKLEVEKLKCEDLRLSLSGSGSVSCENTVATQTEVNLSGAGHVKLSGKTGTAKYRTSGAGSIEADDYKAQHVDTYSSGVSRVSCHAQEMLKARTTGKSSVRYKGNPQTDSPKGTSLRRL